MPYDRKGIWYNWETEMHKTYVNTPEVFSVRFTRKDYEEFMTWQKAKHTQKLLASVITDRDPGDE